MAALWARTSVASMSLWAPQAGGSQPPALPSLSYHVCSEFPLQPGNIPGQMLKAILGQTGGFNLGQSHMGLALCLLPLCTSFGSLWNEGHSLTWPPQSAYVPWKGSLHLLASPHTPARSLFVLSSSHSPLSAGRLCSSACTVCWHQRELWILALLPRSLRFGWSLWSLETEKGVKDYYTKMLWKTLVQTQACATRGTDFTTAAQVLVLC